MKTLVMTGGGTLGHCIPNLALLPYLKNAFDKIYYVGSENGPERQAVQRQAEYFSVTTTKLDRSFDLENLFIPFKLIKGVRQAEDILTKLRPDVVFSKGGFVSVPVCFAAAKLKIPLISHESDLTIGLANRLTCKKCAFVLTSFPQTAKKLKNGVYTGPPIRDEILDDRSFEARKKYALPHKKPVILVVGGSSGAKAVNDFIIDNLDAILSEYEVLHICGSKHTNELKRKGYRQIGFEKDMALAYSACDFAVSRCGSNTAFELMARKIPTLFIPLPKSASRGDQIDNADYFTRRNCALTAYEENLTLDVFSESLKTLRLRKRILLNGMANLKLDSANQRIADIIISQA